MTDLISRQDAIKAIEGIIRAIAEKRHADNILTYACSMLSKLQSVQSASRWIPVGERLPMNDESVIASVKDEMGDTPFTFTTVAWHYNGTWVADNERIHGVTAWQPLPEPYEEATT